MINTDEYWNERLNEHLNQDEQLPEMDECEICLTPIPFNAKAYKFTSTNLNKNVTCGCYDCYIFELENKNQTI